ncbi:hypothetical protein BKA82DRAFT_29121 [Pisolithus tinctorius]|uniref:Uncharacterized protein n=1 Tax=Pisolithus tinctorius Marx 270 TaxID=870435 RepID=A0A0C3P081_PISTI|nr:hypothetical protein BKA82DRAFT_29121 [Pisolithus tinctorius]KIO00916.1 hypothetical protein M404DRAFT_29121 [Pisolithus tinctorius Marx 270]
MRAFRLVSAFAVAVSTATCKFFGINVLIPENIQAVLSPCGRWGHAGSRDLNPNPTHADGSRMRRGHVTLTLTLTPPPGPNGKGKRRRGTSVSVGGRSSEPKAKAGPKRQATVSINGRVRARTPRTCE